ncbi:aldehyde dehydrogenase family protein [Pseudomonas sp. DTU_2021_1001937_2_SI_NGA_ILE_001]|uniref:aldehyde dehydrogenase family protein n=1 Tax=Pseudomonas sp. DTU_2021_1001937_2_SI_NGA_ILE_001 TaxID=3077589 RepID=UPI0025DEF3AD|nr:aldehyde dehydrogenase family protein [Pseudomonas sp. DTU_2021_1001937_2_SI_NGA_ILE_001]WNW09886.1 aldehyde dehydrogenase family protein [Pseudomonas sp. DTU_2021_1001937_2_SI_NGA_ILE_001]
MSEIALLPAVRAFLAAPHGLFIDGTWQAAASGRRLEVENPASASVIAAVAEGAEADADAAVAAARAAFEGPWRQVSPARRGQLLWQLAELIDRHAEELAQLITLENGKPIANARGEAASAASIVRYFAGWPTKIEGSTLPVSPASGAPMLNYTLREPVGVCALIVPWNFPLTMCVWKLGPVLATGCTAVLKPAEQTPLVAVRLVQLIEQAGFPAGVVNLLTGLGLHTGAPLAAHAGVDKVAFTGSTQVGRLIAQAATGNMKKVSLELGGKSPNIILPDADIARAAKGAADGIFYNQGQVCTAASRLYVHESVLDAVLDELQRHARAHVLGPGLDSRSTLGPLVSGRQLETVTGYLRRGTEEGAELVCGGGRPEHLEQGHFIQPTVFLDRAERACVAREEIFGPVLTVMSWREPEDLVQRANDSPYGLAAGLWTRDLRSAHRLAAQLKAGSIWINCWNVVDPASPFGGYKQSGWGREMSKHVIDAYTETKSVFVDLA